MWTFPQFLYGFGGSIVKDFPNKDMHPVFDSPEAIKAVNFYATLVRDYGFKGATDAHWAEIVIAMQQGKAAIMIDGSPLVGRILDPEKSSVLGKIGFSVVPRGPAKRWPPVSGHALAIPVGSENKELAWKFIQWALSKETQLKNALMHSETALTRKSCLENSDYLKKFNWGDGEYVRVVKETFDKWAQPYYRPLTPEWPQVNDTCSIAISKVLTGEETTEKALEKANKELYRIYKEAGYF
jgi:ABC-type glycerol-3-phosphate transport system substrate-binding protein